MSCADDSRVFRVVFVYSAWVYVMTYRAFERGLVSGNGLRVVGEEVGADKGVGKQVQEV